MRRFLDLFICIVLSFLVFSCSFLAGPREYCDVQFSVPGRVGTDDKTPNVESWIVEVYEEEAKEPVFSNTYGPGEIVEIKDLLEGNYRINILGSNGDSIFTKSTKTTVTAGIENKINITLDNVKDIKKALSNLGQINGVYSSNNSNSYTAPRNEDYYYISRLYTFSSFNEKFLSLLNSTENNRSGYFQNNKYNVENNLAIEVNVQFNRVTLEIEQYFLFIKNKSDESNPIYFESMNPEYFDNLTTNFEETIKIKTAIDNYITEDFDKNIQKLGTTGVNSAIQSHEALLPYAWREDNMYYTRLYVFDSLDTTITDQLKEKKGNCDFHFNSIYDDKNPVKSPFVQLGIGVIPSKFNSSNPTDSFSYNLRFEAEGIDNSEGYPGYSVWFNNENDFNNFLTSDEHPFNPPHGISFTLPESAITELDKIPKNPEALQFNAIVRSTNNSKSTQNYIVTPGELTEIKDLENGTYVMDIVGSDGDNVLIGTTPEFTVNDDFSTINLPTLTKVETNIKTNLENLGKLNKIYSPNSNYGVDVYIGEKENSYFIKRLYVFDNYTTDFQQLINGQQFTENNLNDYNLDNKTNYMIEIKTGIKVQNNQEGSPVIDHYNLSVTSGKDTNMNTDCIFKHVFDDLKSNPKKHLDAKNKFNEEFNKIDATILGTNPQIINHDSICPYIYHSNKLNDLTYTRLYIFDSLKPEIEDQISGKKGTAGWNFSIDNEYFTDKSIIQIELDIDCDQPTSKIKKTIHIYSPSLTNATEHMAVEPNFTTNTIDNFLNGTNYTIDSFYGN